MRMRGEYEIIMYAASCYSSVCEMATVADAEMDARLGVMFAEGLARFPKCVWIEEVNERTLMWSQCEPRE